MTTTLSQQPKLPHGRIERADMLCLLDKIAPHIGLKSGPLHTLRRMIEESSWRDWITPDAEPICYREQIKIAQSLNIETRTIRSHERLLEKLKLVEIRTRGDGSRGAFGKGAVMGISFKPLLDRLDDFLSLKEKATEEEKRCGSLRAQLSSARRHLTKQVSELLTYAPKHPALPELLNIQNNLPRRYEGLSSEDLKALYQHVDETVRRVAEILIMQQKSSGAAEKNIRPYIQLTTDSFNVICNEPCENLRTACKQADYILFTNAPTGAKKCLEDRRGEGTASSNRKIQVAVESFGPRKLYNIAGEAMKLYLQAQQPLPDALTEYDFTQAALGLASIELNIREDVLSQAVNVMGDLATALTILVLDANRFHPDKPITNPGGALRRFTELAGKGRFNLYGSLKGLESRYKSTKTALSCGKVMS